MGWDKCQIGHGSGRPRRSRQRFADLVAGAAELLSDALLRPAQRPQPADALGTAERDPVEDQQGENDQGQCPEDDAGNGHGDWEEVGRCRDQGSPRAGG